MRGPAFAVPVSCCCVYPVRGLSLRVLVIVIVIMIVCAVVYMLLLLLPTMMPQCVIDVRT